MCLVQIVEFLMTNTTRATAADALKHRTNEQAKGDDFGFEFVSLEDEDDDVYTALPPGAVANPMSEKSRKYITADLHAPSPTTDSASEALVNPRTTVKSDRPKLGSGPSMPKLGKAISVRTLGIPKPPGNNEPWYER